MGRDSRYDSAQGSRFDYRPPQGDFTFRAERPPGVQDSSYDSYRDRGPPPSFGGSNSDPYRSHEPRHNNRRDFSGGRNHRGGYRGSNLRGRGSFRGGPRKAADRILLRQKHDDNAEALLGDTTGKATYRNVDDLSDSDEADMDISGESGSENGAPAKKRVRLNNNSDDSSVPKWSNPDPYTSLPPPDETQRKKKDVVQLIRKARVESEAQKPTAPEAADFISFDFSDAESDKDKNKDKDNDNDKSHPDGGQSRVGPGMPNAPVGPRATTTLPSSLPPRPPAVPSMQSQPAQANTGNPAASTPAAPTTHPASTKLLKQRAPADLTPSSTLGSRKRTYDDQIKPPHQKLKKGKKMRANSSVDIGWQVTADEEPCPWVVEDHSSELNMGVR